MNDLDDEQRKRVHGAHRALEELDRLHEVFMQKVAQLYEPEPTAGALSVVEKELHARCLSHDVVCGRRFVSVGDVPSAVEYAFGVTHDDKLVPLLTLYLKADRNLYRDPSLTEGGYQLTNAYTGGRILDDLAIALLESPVFSPKPAAPATAVP